MQHLDLRALGPAGLDLHLQHHGAAASPDLDRVCAQHAAHTTLLYWFTELDAARAEARRTGRPILSLHLLGRLDQARSCANSRFFRALLYPAPAINALLRERFILHWHSVRPVPTVTIDFGDGRTLVRTLTGNSLHLVLDPSGHPIDALPGLFAPSVFHALLQRSLAAVGLDRRRLAAHHTRALRTPIAAPPEPAPSPALAASALAMTKHVVEAPVLRAVAPTTIDADTHGNLALHARIHDAFARGFAGTGAQLVAWIYESLFLMPPDDPSLGLDVADPV
jgi:hypothetical protein